MISPDDRFDTFIEEIQIVNSREMQQVDNLQQKYTGAIPKNSSPPSALMQPKAEHLPKKFQTLVELINSGVRVCVIMRGLPGSGKSYLAYQIIEATVKNPELHIFSADKFFTNSRGQYKFEPDKLQQAHELAQRQFTQKACQGTSPLIVDNTNMTYWEMYYYLQVAVQYSYHIEILEPETPWKFAEGKLASKNQHSVPFEKIKMMKQKYETGVSLDQLLASINLQRVRNPLMRKIPPLQSAVPEVISQVVVKQPVMKDLIAFDEEPMQRQQTDSPSKNSKDTTAPPPNRWRTPSPVFEDTWDGSGDKVDAPNEKSSPKNEPQPPKKNRKNKNRSPPAKFSPHRKSCPNENARFSQIRDLYPNVKDSCLWDFFVRCDGDADYCVNLLMDENLADQMEAGCELTCACFGADVTKAVVKEPIKPKPQSPTAKPKKSKQEVKQINLNEYLEAKQVIERGITIAPEHYPEHVKMVKQWKNGPTLPSEETTFDNTMDNTSESNSPEISEELHALPIANDLILELDDQYGGGLLKHIMEGADSHKFPSKIFIRKSTAHQLYIEIMEAYYSQAEEEKIHNMKKDEELAKKLNDEEVARGTKSFKKNGLKDHIEFITNEVQNTWINEESEGDMALRMSKEKLVQMFPQLNKNDLLEIFAGTNYNFNDTVATIQDSLSCTKEERAQMAQKQKQLFNTPWKDPNTERHDAHQSEDLDESSSEQYRTLENLRQEMKDRKEEQKVCLNKAREAIQKKSYELATYYSNIAQFHKQKHEEASHEAANMTASIHEQRQQTSTTLDLHYFSQIEASMVLDTYLDHWISRLRTIKKPYEELFLITGRGKNSINGIAAVKNKTKSRLRERTLNCTEENPGLLKVKVYPQSLLSNEFQ